MLVVQLCPTLCDPMDCSLPGSSVHEIHQARILEWVAVPFSRGSSRPRDQTQASCIAGRFFTVWAPGKHNHFTAEFPALLSGSSLRVADAIFSQNHLSPESPVPREDKCHLPQQVCPTPPGHGPQSPAPCRAQLPWRPVRQGTGNTPLPRGRGLQGYYRYSISLGQNRSPQIGKRAADEPDAELKCLCWGSLTVRRRITCLPGVFCVVTDMRGIERHSGWVNRTAGIWKVHTMDPLPFHAAEFPQEPVLLGL